MRAQERAQPARYAAEGPIAVVVGKNGRSLVRATLMISTSWPARARNPARLSVVRTVPPMAYALPSRIVTFGVPRR